MKLRDKSVYEVHFKFIDTYDKEVCYHYQEMGSDFSTEEFRNYIQKNFTKQNGDKVPSEDIIILEVYGTTTHCEICINRSVCNDTMESKCVDSRYSLCNTKDKFIKCAYSSLLNARCHKKKVYIEDKNECKSCKEFSDKL